MLSFIFLAGLLDLVIVAAFALSAATWCHCLGSSSSLGFALRLLCPFPLVYLYFLIFLRCQLCHEWRAGW